jgi:hypothetical protein
VAIVKPAESDPVIVTSLVRPVVNVSGGIIVALTGTAITMLMPSTSARTSKILRIFLFIFLLLLFSFLYLNFPCYFRIALMVLLIGSVLSFDFQVASTQGRLKASQLVPYSSIEAMNTLFYFVNCSICLNRLLYLPVVLLVG